MTTIYPSEYDLSEHGILDIINNGESETVEFKEKSPSDSILSKILSSFANTRGGLIIFGITEIDRTTKVISGLTDIEAKKIIDQVQTISSILFNKHILCQEYFIRGKKIVIAIIDPVADYLKPITTSSGELFFRVGPESKKIDYKPQVIVSKTKKIKIFIAMSFRTEEDPALIDYYEAMKRAVIKTKLPIDLIRIDQKEGDYEISQEIMDEILKTDALIADFTLNPRNVYFELGYARGCQKKIIQCAKSGTSLEFDIRNWRTIFYKNATDLEVQFEKAIENLYKECVE